MSSSFHDAGGAGWITIPAGNNSTSTSAWNDDLKDGGASVERNLILLWEFEVQPLTDVQRLIFLSLTICVAIIAVLGNILVIYVNHSRKQRFLFRMCLISLAISDLIFVVVTTCIYVSKFITRNTLLWFLGPVACSLFAFLQTLVVLTNSVMLVCIAFDRYMAIVRILKGSWEPSKLFCLACCTIIWGFSAAVSSPLISIYEFHRVYVIPEPEKRGDELNYYVGYLCGSDKEENGYYFAILSTFIFLPLFVTFVWLNSRMAKEVWKRRARFHLTVSVVDENFSSSTRATTGGPPTSEIITTRRIKRRQRQVRMFKVILSLMLVFFICRLPNWIFLLMKLGIETEGNIHWVLNYSFGLGVMTNCMLNPFLYTFLSETIRLTTFLAEIICGIFTAVFHLITCKICCNRRTPQSNCVDAKQQYFDTL